VSLVEIVSPPLRLTAGTLQPIRRLLGDLESSGVGYCHWKGNHSLDAALAGRKDLDLLVDPDGGPMVAGALAGAGYRRLVDAPHRRIPGVEHWLAFDRDEGVFAHLHLHWQLIPTKGNPTLVRLPWERIVLASTVRHERRDVRIPAPEMELLLFLMSRALRVRQRHAVAERLGRPFLDAHAVAELAWLSGRTSVEHLSSRASELLDGAAATLVTAMRNSTPKVSDFLALRRAVAAQFVAASDSPATRSARRRSSARTTGRTLTTGGRIIAFVGSDGAGKSTVVRAITEWLSKEIETRALYLGAGDGAISVARRTLRMVDRTRRFFVSSNRTLPEPRREDGLLLYRHGASYVAGVEPGLRAVWKIMSKLSLAREKRARLRAAAAWRASGIVVVCDRYPQVQQLGFNDGPQLWPWMEHGTWWMRTAARGEFEAYEMAETFHPDLVVKLIVPPERAAERKHDMSVELLRTRGEAVRSLRFGPGTRVVEIDAGNALATVLAETKRVIWQNL
jgi:hypothetical protein